MPLPSSDQDVLLLHNPRCSKSRQVKALLEDRGVSFTERLYLEEPLSADELLELGRRLSRPLGEWTRSKERDYAESGLDASASDEAHATELAQRPILMERPILVVGTSARIGRPPEDVLELLP